MKLAGIIAVFLALGLCGCAEEPGGIIVINKETIENFFERDALKSWNPPSQLNLLLDQPVAKAELPPVPAGEIRLYGTLDSVGPYRTTALPPAGSAQSAKRGSTFRDSVYGYLGKAGDGGNAWFYADINKATGSVSGGRAYLYGFYGGVCDMRESARIMLSDAGFILTIDGYCAFPSESGTTAAYELVIQGDANPLAVPDPRETAIKYIIDNNGKFAQVPKDPQNFWEIYDYGTGEASVRR